MSLIIQVQDPASALEASDGGEFFLAECICKNPFSPAPDVITLSFSGSYVGSWDLFDKHIERQTRRQEFP